MCVWSHNSKLKKAKNEKANGIINTSYHILQMEYI